jgi:hypothetical protein
MSTTTSNGKSKHVFLTEEQIINALAFSLAPTLLGELSKEKKKEEHFEFTTCYDAANNFIGFAIEKKHLIG